MLVLMCTSTFAEVEDAQALAHMHQYATQIAQSADEEVNFREILLLLVLVFFD